MPADGDRHVVPRWRPSGSKLSAVELSPDREVGRLQVERDLDLEERERDFRNSRSFWTAADLISSAVSRGVSNPLVLEAASLLGNLAYKAPALGRLLARMSSSTDESVDTVPLNLASLNHDAGNRVRFTRALLRESPRSAMRWLDLALAHLTLGNQGAARRAIHSALSIAPNNRVVLRSSARFFVHSRQPDEALFWLERSGRLENDPWLLAAHLAVSQVAKLPLKRYRLARELLADNGLTPLSSSELFAVVASEELSSGRAKPARFLMNSALRQPTENSIAQAVWSIDRGLGGFEIDQGAAPRAFEARALSALQKSEWETALLAAESWIADEPFSVRAAMHASYIALTGFEDYSKALDFTQLGLRTSPNHAMLLNNAAFSLANLGRTDEANLYLDLAKTDDEEIRFMLEATRGLTRFREGNIEAGRSHYRRAYDKFKQDGSLNLAALCQVMWAREEMRARTEVGDRLFDEASHLTNSSSSTGARIWLARVTRQLKGVGDGRPEV